MRGKLFLVTGTALHGLFEEKHCLHLTIVYGPSGAPYIIPLNDVFKFKVKDDPD